MLEHVLYGCTPTPLAAYLKALAILRLIAEQAGDPRAAGRWHADVFVLRTRLSRDEVLQYFLHHYRPTPLVAPWNGGSGFYSKDNRDGIAPLAASTCPRFQHFRQAIELGQHWIESLQLSESPKNEKKHELLKGLRGNASDDLVRWIDAAVILSDDDPSYPPLLGTGGNDGRLEFTNNFMQRLGEVLDVASGKPKAGSAELLLAALFGQATAALSKSAIGQFLPGNAGGPNASSGFEGDSRTNPWDFILMLEGAVVLACSAVRRLESSRAAALSAPFTVRSRAATAGAAATTDDSDARGEIWMPLWTTPLTVDEVVALFSEGRAAVGRKAAQDGLDFARAVARLGVDRGITSFQRYGFLKRSGKAYLATPLNRVPVRRNPHADLIDELDQGDWLTRVQRYARDDRSPNAYRSLCTQLDAALFALTERRDRRAVETVLRLLGRIESLAARSTGAGEQVTPVPTLSAAWVQRTNDGSPEFRIAAALAGLSVRTTHGTGPVTLTLRPHLVRISLDGRTWDQYSQLACWGEGPIDRNLAAVLHRRRLAVIRLGVEGELLHSRAGATLGDVRCFLDGGTDDRRIAELAHGLACVGDLRGLEPPGNDAELALDAAYAFLKPFFVSDATLHALQWLPPERTLLLPADIPAHLAADNVTAALRIAWRRLGAAGLAMPGREPPQTPRRGLGPRLLAALTIPLAYRESARLLRWLALDTEYDVDITA